MEDETLRSENLACRPRIRKGWNSRISRSACEKPTPRPSEKTPGGPGGGIGLDPPVLVWTVMSQLDQPQEKWPLPEGLAIWGRPSLPSNTTCCFRETLCWLRRGSCSAAAGRRNCWPTGSLWRPGGCSMIPPVQPKILNGREKR